MLYLPAESSHHEVVVRKDTDDGFHGTPLAGLLTSHHVRRIVIAGLMSEMCVSATARVALARGFTVVLPHDAHATYDIPAVAGLSDAVPAAMVSRVAEWALGDQVRIVPHAADVRFTDTTGTPERTSRR